MKYKKYEPYIYRIYDELSTHRGRENAIAASKLGALFFGTIPEATAVRVVRELIRKIRRSETFDNVIASCDNGYYWATENEAADANRRLFNQAFDLLKTATANDRKAGRNGQMMIKLSEYQRLMIKSLCEGEDK